VGGETNSIGIAEARSALAWWLEAGVDVAVQEQPRDWLKPASAKPQASVEQQPPNVAQPSHETLSDLQHWLASSVQLPFASATSQRVMPQGPENAAIMLLSEAPALEDFAAAQPIGGDSWELAKRMLAAIRIPVEQAYSASLSCFHAPGSKMSPADREACAEIARRHIRLAKPKRLLLLGDPKQATLGVEKSPRRKSARRAPSKTKGEPEQNGDQPE